MVFRGGNLFSIVLFLLLLLGCVSFARSDSGGGGTSLDGSLLLVDKPAVPITIGGGLSVNPGSVTGTRTTPGGNGDYPLVDDSVFTAPGHLVLGQRRPVAAGSRDGLVSFIRYLEENTTLDDSNMKAALEEIAKAALVFHLGAVQGKVLEAMQLSLEVLGGVALAGNGS